MPQNAALHARDWRIVQMKAQGQSTAAIAEIMGMDRRTVERRLSRPEMRRALADALASVQLKAIEAVADLLDSEDPRVRLLAARIAFPTVVVKPDEGGDDDPKDADAALLKEIPTGELLKLVKPPDGD
ncbi:MAG TPA: helix-turn-helix domain-containing protein [Phycisphaerales bacterium]|nr:helix-turn-helix domain-containing protein [Phycisphaerales bacterium]